MASESDADRDVERILRAAIEQDGGENDDCHQVDVGILNRLISSQSSFTAEGAELAEDDTLKFVSEWNLVTEAIFDEDDEDEDVLVVSQTHEEQCSDTEDRPQSNQQQHLRVPTSGMAPLISSEDDDTMIISRSSANVVTSELPSLPQLEIENCDADHDDADEIGRQRREIEFELESSPLPLEEEEDEILDEAEESRRYLSINSTLLYRWSEGMIPTIGGNTGTTTTTTTTNTNTTDTEGGNVSPKKSTKTRSSLSSHDYNKNNINNEIDHDGNCELDADADDDGDDGDDLFGISSDYDDDKKIILEKVKNGASIPEMSTQTTNRVSTAMMMMMRPRGGTASTAALSLKSPWIVERLKHLAKAYSDRTTFVRNAIEQMSSSSSSSSSADSTNDEEEYDDGEDDRNGDETGGYSDTTKSEKAKPRRKRRKRKRSKVGIDRTKEHFTFESIFGDELHREPDPARQRLDDKCDRLRQGSREKNQTSKNAFSIEMQIAARRVWHKLTHVFEPQSAINVTWLAVLAIALCYNAISILFRAVFPYERESGTKLFVVLDATFDVAYLLDIVWFKCRTKFVQNGQWISEAAKIRSHYFASSQLKRDIAAIIPLDYVILFAIGADDVQRGWSVAVVIQRLSRLNRLLKVDSFWQFFDRLDAIVTRYPHLLRIVHTLCYLLYAIHVGACAYYLISAYEGFGSTPWTYDHRGNAYLRCFYFAFRTSASIGGRLPKPSNAIERVYMTVIWLLGVFVFAMVIGQIRDIAANASRNDDYYRDIMDKTGNYMRRLAVPGYVQQRVRYWLHFTWRLQKTFDESTILRVLPLKSRTDMALSVHHQTLSRVELFKNIDQSVLRDIVLKLRPILFLPGDYVCRRGDVGHEMYIVSKGRIQVIAGGDGDQPTIFALGEGCVFGEIAILNLEGFTRRTADVRSVGYSQLFALSKTDLWETLKNYPEYQATLKRKVKRILRKKRRQQRQSWLNEEERARDDAERRTAKRRRRQRRRMLKNRLSAENEKMNQEKVIINDNRATNNDNDEHVTIMISSDSEKRKQKVENGQITATTIPSVCVAPPELSGKSSSSINVSDTDNDNDQVYDQEENEEDHDHYDNEDYDFDDYDEDDDEVFGVEVESVLKERPRTPKLFDAVMVAVRPDSKVKGYFSRSQSISSVNYRNSFERSFEAADDLASLNAEYAFENRNRNNNINNLEVKISVEDVDE